MNHSFTEEEIQQHLLGEVLSPLRVKEATPLFSSHFYTDNSRMNWGIGVYYWGESPIKVMRPKTEAWLEDNPWFWQGFEALWEKNKEEILKNRRAEEAIQERLWQRIGDLIAEYGNPESETINN